MPRGSNKKQERQYERIKEGYKKRGKSEKTAKEIAARTVNKERREKGETQNKRTMGTGTPRSSYDDRTKDELINLAKKKGLSGYSKMKKGELEQALREAG